MKTGNNKSFFRQGSGRNAVWNNKWLIIIPLVMTPLISYTGSFFVKPSYEASVIVLTGESFGLSADLRQLVGDELTALSLYDFQSDIRSLQNEIVSTPFISRLSRELKLDEKPEIDKAARQVQAAWPHLSLDKIKLNILQNVLEDKINIELVGGNQVRIIVESDSPSEARDMAQSLGEIFISEKMKQQIGILRISQDFSYSQLEKYEKSLEVKIAERTALEKEFLKVRPDSLILSAENRQAIATEIDDARLEITRLEKDIVDVMRRISHISPDRIKLRESFELVQLKIELQNHMESTVELVSKYQWNSPILLTFNSRSYQYMENIESEIGRLVEKQFDQYDKQSRDDIRRILNARAHLNMLYSRRNQLELAYNELQNKLGLSPEFRARLDQLDREVAAIREIRERLLQQQESSQITQAILRGSEFKVIEPAQLPLNPLWPNRDKIILMSIILGFIVGAGTLSMVEMADNSYKRIDEVEKHLGLPVIGVVPEIAAAKKVRPDDWSRGL